MKRYIKSSNDAENKYYYAYPIKDIRRLIKDYLYWEDDLGTINSLNEDIREINQQLEGENELLRSHNEWLQKLSSAVSQNRLYDELTTKLSPWLHKMKEILNEELSCGGEDGFG